MEWENLNSEKSYSAINAYNNSKLANILFTKELAERLKSTQPVQLHSLDFLLVLFCHLLRQIQAQ